MDDDNIVYAVEPFSNRVGIQVFAASMATSIGILLC